jgi:iron complex transport system ATP-binding protein
LTSMENHIAVSVKDLSVGYKNTIVSAGINFDVHKGELMGIVGINGIGKSTLLRTLAKVHPKLSGSIHLNKKPIEDYASNDLASTLSVVLTESIASKNMTVLELVALGRQPYTNWIGKLSQGDISKITGALQLLELEELKHKKCYELSDGQVQRVMIARALAQDTSIILLDEPTTHLDLYHKIQILKLLRTIAKETQKTILFTSHEIEIVIQLCDTMLLLDDTKNDFGSPCELIEKKSFDTLFPADTVTFDASTGTFRIEK